MLPRISLHRVVKTWDYVGCVCQLFLSTDGRRLRAARQANISAAYHDHGAGDRRLRWPLFVSYYETIWSMYVMPPGPSEAQRTPTSFDRSMLSNSKDQKTHRPDGKDGMRSPPLLTPPLTCRLSRHVSFYISVSLPSSSSDRKMAIQVTRANRKHANQVWTFYDFLFFRCTLRRQKET